MTTTEHFQLDCGGDTLEVIWTGNVYRAPSCGAEYASRNAAMRQELQDYLRACGEDVEAADLVLDEYGSWID